MSEQLSEAESVGMSLTEFLTDIFHPISTVAMHSLASCKFFLFFLYLNQMSTPYSLFMVKFLSVRNDYVSINPVNTD